VFVPRRLVIRRFIDEMEQAFVRVFGTREPECTDLLRRTAYFALEKMAQSDCLYHDLEHGILAVSAGQDILLGKRMVGEALTAKDWLEMITALLYFNLGYVRGACRGDARGRCATGVGEQSVTVPRGATGAALTPYLVGRAKSLARLHLGSVAQVDLEQICRNIEYTRFPPATDGSQDETDTYAGLTRAAHYIGAIADPNYMRKINALFLEFQENGLAAELGFETAIEFREGYARLFEGRIRPLIATALGYLAETREGNRWIANMNAHIHAELYQEAAMGIVRRQ